MPALPGMVLLPFLVTVGLGQMIPAEIVNWPEVRDRQPAGVSLKLELPKTGFREGEIINATLVYTNSSPAPYHLWTGTSDRSGRLPDIAFYATDSDGQPVPDPLRWYFQRGGRWGGLSQGMENLGEWQITLPVNQWLRFARPGRYQLFAYSNRVQEGDPLSGERFQEDGVELVSDPVTITINPLSTEEEQRILAEARAGLAAGGQSMGEAVTTLCYLGTPAARAELLPLLDPMQSFSISMALFAAPDPAAEAPAVLAAVKEGRLKLNRSVIFAYQTLKTADFAFTPASEENREARTREYRAWQKAAEEITAAAIATTDGQGTNHYQALLVTLHQEPNNAAIRAALVEVQLELTSKQAEAVIQGWRTWGGEDFLPVVRNAVGEPTYSPEALKVLAQIRPEEARPLIIEGLRRRPPRYLVPDGGLLFANEALLSLPRSPIPELEPDFRRQLATGGGDLDLFLLIPAIDRYGTPELLPDVIAFYAPKEGSWASEIQASVLRFWLRCDAAAGARALARALKARDTTVLSRVLLEEWNAAALPVVTAALDDPDPEVVASAIKVLEYHADRRWLDPSLAALQRTVSAATEDNFHAVQETARLLLEGSRWKLDAAQRRQLEKLAARRPK